MKHYIPAIAFFFFFTIVTDTYCQQPCMNEFLGSKTLYAPTQLNYTAGPKGYTPVYINHVGRHGARHLTKEVNTSFAYILVMDADKQNALTTQGQELKKMICALERIEKENINDISLTGRQEQHDIAARMLKNYPTVFASHPACVEIAVTKKIRTQESADAFMSGLQSASIQPCNLTHTIQDETLRFYDLSPAYLDYQKNEAIQQQVLGFSKAIHADTLGTWFIQKFFVADFIHHLNQQEKYLFMDELAGFAAILPSIQRERILAGIAEPEIDFFSWFPCSEWQLLEKANGLDDFLKKGPGEDNNGIQVKIASPLLADFIQTTDAFISGKEIAANLRFTHAEAIAPFAALLGIEEASQATDNLMLYDDKWKSSKIIPLSANIQWILYKGENNQWLVKFLLNEKEVKIKGIAADQFPYYPWKDIRSFYTNRLEKLGLELEGDKKTFLLQVK